jgi:2,3-dihydroxybiphenyl 1,2-dioxygenase
MQLGYIVFQVQDVAAWERFGRDVLGLIPVEARAGSLAFRSDGHAQRILVEPGPADDLIALGLEVDQEATLDELAKSLGATSGDATARRVHKLYLLEDPSGIPVEVCCGAERARTPFASPVVRSGFVADDLGLGHVVLSARDVAASRGFYEKLGFRLSDRIVTNVHGFAVDMAFFHVNPRHHTLALGGPQRRRIHHFMLEARAMDEVGLCFDRTLKAGLPIMHTLGRHPNDRMFSFYAKTPSGFQFEFGWGGREIDDATWEPAVYDHISEWGHHPPQFLASKPASLDGSSGKPSGGR